jgi:hypothetical protein
MSVEHINNKSRNFNVGGEKSYPLCDSGCSFNITKLDKEDFIEGLTLSASSNLLHINPLVNTKELSVEKRNKSINLNYSFKRNGDTQKYSLVDIFFRTPSKSIINGKRYEMETCLVFNSSNKKLFVVICIPNKVSPVNNTDNDDEKDLFIFLNKIGNNFNSGTITKNKTASITDISNWNPLMFFPPKKGTNASFYTWLDQSTNNTVMYIQFEKPKTVPYNFFKYFSDTLSGGTDSVRERTSLKEDPTNAELEVYYNINENITPVITRRVCKTETNKDIQSFLSERNQVDGTDKNTNNVNDNCNKPNVSNKKNKFNIILLFIGLISLGLLGIIIYYIFKYKNIGFKNTLYNNKILHIIFLVLLITLIILIVVYYKKKIKKPKKPKKTSAKTNSLIGILIAILLFMFLIGLCIYLINK